jgi:hypothetical protein
VYVYLGIVDACLFFIFLPKKWKKNFTCALEIQLLFLRQRKKIENNKGKHKLGISKYAKDADRTINQTRMDWILLRRLCVFRADLFFTL